MAIDTAAAAPEHGPPSPNWRFLVRPFWLFSHVFVVASVVLFINLGFWQLRRLDERQGQNARVLATTELAPVELTTANEIDGLEQYRQVEVVGRWRDADFARIVNRSQNGVPGEYVVGLVEFADGSVLSVNRGFVGLSDDRSTDPDTDRVDTVGWVQPSVAQGRFTPTDTGQSRLMPRFDTAMVTQRLGQPVPDNWLQVSPDPTTRGTPVPDPVPLPPIDDGPHLGYALQWFTFAAMTLGFYAAILRRKGQPNQKPTAGRPGS